MATIEPRLIHLLNDSQTPNLPPIDIPSFGASAGGHSLSLPPLEPDAGQRFDRSAAPTHIAPLYTANDETLLKYNLHDDNNANENPASRISSSARPLQQLLVGGTDPEPNPLSFSLRMLVDDSPDLSEDFSKKKRHRALTTKEDFVQLPQPLKKQKSTQQVAAVVPPIINGLHEPPPNAAVFPPISDSFNDRERINLGLLKEFNRNDHSNGNTKSSLVEDRDWDKSQPSAVSVVTPAKAAASTTSSEGAEKNSASGSNGGSARVKRRAAKPRRKWSEEETNHLLLGVHRHGVGKWTSILEDPEYKFNDRTAGDLKDRFRTCCPEELRGASSSKNDKNKSISYPCPSTPTGSVPVGGLEFGKIRPKNGSLPLENILLDPYNGAGSPTSDNRRADHNQGLSGQQVQHDSDNSSTKQQTQQQRKSRAHRKKLEDLAELGIRGPFKKSHRRERRPFTENDDKEILEGLDQYGPAWTKIQRDPKFHLSSRQPTDLRDRVRNKYPEIYSKIEKGSFQVKDATAAALLAQGGSGGLKTGQGGGSGPLEPNISRAISSASLLGSTTLGTSASASTPVSSSNRSRKATASSLDSHHLARSRSKEEIPPMSKWMSTTTNPTTGNSAFYESTDSLPGLAGVFGDVMNDGPPSAVNSLVSSSGTATEMDISRLLLDDSQVSSPVVVGDQQHHFSRTGGTGHSEELSTGVTPAPANRPGGVIMPLPGSVSGNRGGMGVSANSGLGGSGYPRWA